MQWHTVMIKIIKIIKTTPVNEIFIFDSKYFVTTIMRGLSKFCGRQPFKIWRDMSA